MEELQRIWLRKKVMNKLKYSLALGRPSLGTWIQIPHPSIVEIIANSANDNLDWICIDMEHGSIGVESMTDLIRTISGCGLTPFVRIPKNDYVWIHRVLDAGARGLFIPMIKNRIEAEEAVSEVLYPPEGKRSFGYSRANLYGENFIRAVHDANDEISIVLQIEDKEAINHLNDILNVKNFDGTFIGPYDLSGSIGKPGDFKNAEYKLALSHYMDRSKVYDISMGIHIVRPTREKIKKAVNDGYKIIAIGTDAVFLEEKCNEVLGEINELL